MNTFEQSSSSQTHPIYHYATSSRQSATRLLISCGYCCMWLLVLVSSQQVRSLSNLRIQVNNENLQSPPYLLEAIERASESAVASSIVVGPQVSGDVTPSSTTATAPAADTSTTAIDATAADESGGEARIESTDENLVDSDGSSGGNLMGVVREETIEDMLDLEPESVLKLSPSNLIDSVEGHPPLAGAQEASGAETRHEPYDDSAPDANSSDKNNRLKSQLPVTSSHLKRPIIKWATGGEDEPSILSSGIPATAPPLTIAPSNESQKSLLDSSTPNSGNPSPSAKSRVSPSVASDQGQEPLPQASSQALAEALEKKTAPLPPDTWEPNQVMAGVTNASHVPATVRRQYGHQTRTRITLGGGYQRNKLPPVVSPPSEEDEPRRPAVASQERPTRNSAHEPSGSLADNSRVIEVPERIVLPASVFKQQSVNSQQRPTQTTTTTTSTTSVVRKRDQRCPSNGLTALEHPSACDKYYLCEDGYSSERTCPNGLMYGTRNVVRDGFCVHRWEVVCGDKSQPNPISSPGCRWQNGIFNVQGSPKCTPDFYECTDGQFEVKKCTQSGQVYDDKTKSCRFAEQVGCAQEALAEFRCPADDQTNTYWPFPRYFLNERALIHCVNDKPEIIRCRDHERVDPENLFCVPIDKAASSTADAETGAVVEVTARRTPANSKNQREKGKKVKPPVEDDHSNE